MSISSGPLFSLLSFVMHSVLACLVKLISKCVKIATLSFWEKQRKEIKVTLKGEKKKKLV